MRSLSPAFSGSSGNPRDPNRILKLRAAEALGRTTGRKLVADGVLLMKDGRIEWPGDGSFLEAWLHCEDRLIAEATPAEFALYRRTKRRLQATSLPPSPAVLHKLQEFAGDKPITRRFANKMIGTCSQADIAAAGMPGMRRVSGRADGAAGQLDQLLAVLPENCIEMMRIALDHAEDVLAPISPNRIGRVLALRGEPCRLFAALGLMRVKAENLSEGMGIVYLHAAERLDAVVDPAIQLDAEALSNALDRLDVPGLSNAERRSFYLLDGLLDGVETFVNGCFGSESATVVTRLPARHVERSIFKSRMYRPIAKAADGQRERRVDHIARLALDLDRVAIACDNRGAQLEELFLQVAASASDECVDGQVIECRGAVVAMDGSLKPGEQIVRFVWRREWDLIVGAGAANPDNDRMAHLRHNRRLSRHLERMHLVYLDTRSASAGATCVEPFFVDFFRFALFEDGIGLSAEGDARRRRMIVDADLPLKYDTSVGLLRSSPGQHSLMRALRESLGDAAPIIIPIANLHHAMSIARIVVRMGVRSGTRITETRQLRMGCCREEMQNGRKRFVAALRPKGAKKDASIQVDPVTLDLIDRLRQLAHDRWFADEFADGLPAVPVVPFRDPARPDLPAGRYILVGRTGLLPTSEITIFIRFLLIGVATATAHVFRYLFATELRLRGASLVELAAALNQAEGSSTTPLYDLSAQVLVRLAELGLLPRGAQFGGS